MIKHPIIEEDIKRIIHALGDEARGLEGKTLLQDSRDVTFPKVETPGTHVPSGGGSPYCRAYSADGKLLALLEYQPENASWHPFKVFPRKPTADIL